MGNRTWRFHDYGGPDSLVLEDLPQEEPGPGQVRVRVRAVGLNRSDVLWIRAGFFKPPLPSKLGAEFCGVVEAVGDDVTAFKPGDRVSNLPIPLTYANFAETTICNERSLVHTPRRLSDVEAASFIFTHITQMCGLVELAQLRAGQTILVTSGTSANGNSAILLAKQMGATVIATSRSGKARDRVIELGADYFVATGEEKLSERVAEITGGRGADVVYDCVGGAITEELLLSCKPGAHWVMYGFLDPSPVTVNWAQWFTRQPTLHFYSLLQYGGSAEMGHAGRPIEFGNAIRGLLALVDSGRLPVPVGTVYEGIDKVPEAFRTMEADAGGGKIVVRF